MASFRPALKKVLAYEGGYANDKDDAGGETYKGIARRFHSTSIMWKEIDRIKSSIKGNTSSDMSKTKTINKLLENNDIVTKEVERIYKKNYWDALHLDEMRSEKIAYQLFETAVNMGVSASIKLAQKTLNVPQTGKFNYSWFVLLKDLRDG